MADEKAAPKAQVKADEKPDLVIEKCPICPKNMLNGRCPNCGFELED